MLMDVLSLGNFPMFFNMFTSEILNVSTLSGTMVGCEKCGVSWGLLVMPKVEKS